MVTIEAVSEQPHHVERCHHVHQRYITLDLIRKRSEHNECLVSTLEEIALHQEELEAVGPILGRCLHVVAWLVTTKMSLVHHSIQVSLSRMENVS